MSVSHNPPPSNASRPADTTSADSRRFFAKAVAAVVGGLLFVCPALAGLRVLLDPLRRTSGGTMFRRIASLDSLPSNGTPRRFPVIGERHDTWTRFPPEPIGAVYLRRLPGDKQVEALNVVCPHLGCSVGFNPQQDEFQCPCHTSAFALDGAMISGPSPRGMDTLECEVRETGGRAEVWVKFENFYTGRTEKTAKA